MVAKWMAQDAREYMRQHPGVRFQKALDIIKSRGVPPKRQSLAPTGTSWLQALGIDDVDTWDPREDWQHASPNSLRTPLGYLCEDEESTATTNLAYIDIAEPRPRESRHVTSPVMPRGALVIIQGVTGAGKLTALTGFLASMAAHHSPDRVRFVLLDFKGLAFDGFDGIPHSSGVFHHIGQRGHVIAGVKAVLEEEMQTRRALLKEHAADSAHEYRARAAGDPSMRPMPNLVIVADEYRELLSAQPGELGEMFMRIATFGETLGMYLVLGTQMIGPETSALMANLSFGISLRTRSVPASVAVLGDETAIDLPKVGVARLRRVGVGNGESPKAFVTFNTSEGLAYRWSDKEESWLADSSATAENRLLRRLSQFARTTDDTLSGRLTEATIRQ